MVHHIVLTNSHIGPYFLKPLNLHSYQYNSLKDHAFQRGKKTVLKGLPFGERVIFPSPAKERIGKAIHQEHVLLSQSGHPTKQRVVRQLVIELIDSSRHVSGKL